jgi:hypothetical protein
MNAKKRKPMDSALEEFVFGTKQPETTTPVPSPQAVTPQTSPQPQESNLMSKLQAPEKEATVRFTIDMSESLHRKLSMLAARTGRKKVDIVRLLLEEALKD